MEKNRLDDVKELLDKYDLRQNATGELRAYLKNSNKFVNLTNDKMTDLSFAYAWARAWVESGCYEEKKSSKKDAESVSERKIPGFDKNGKELYNKFVDIMKDWAHKRDFHQYIDHYRMADLVQKVSDNPYAGRIIFQLLRPDRLDNRKEFHELYETGRMTTELVNQDEWLRRTYKFILNEAEYSLEKGIQPGE